MTKGIGKSRNTEAWPHWRRLGLLVLFQFLFLAGIAAAGFAVFRTGQMMYASLGFASFAAVNFLAFALWPACGLNEVDRASYLKSALFGVAAAVAVAGATVVP
jgi:hypothetical protein